MVSRYYMLHIGFLLFLSVISTNFIDGQIVRTDVGTFVGFVDTVSFNGVTKQVVKYLGIPYGETTAGENRFSKPKPKAPLSEVYYANRPDRQNICIQDTSPENPLNFIPVDRLSEDCLFLSIYAPNGTLAPSSQKYAVMIWIYGGGFTEGALDLYPGDILSSFNDVIVVTINYRLNVFGFFTTGDGVASGNYGLWDQHLAIKWVHDHIGDFGGDENEVTIFGESAGSVSVLCQAMFSGNRGYFKRVIAQSGSPTMPFVGVTPSNLSNVAETAGCSKSSSQEMLGCLRSKSWEDLLTAGLDPNIIYAPALDGDFFKRPPRELYLDPNSEEMAFYSSLDVIIGVNDLESAMFLSNIYAPLLGIESEANFTVTRDQFEQIILPFYLPYFYLENEVTPSMLEAVALKYTDWSNPNSPETTRAMLMDFTTDLSFHIPSIISADVHAEMVVRTGSGGFTYFYLYTFCSGVLAAERPEWARKGAYHADEIYAVFGLWPWGQYNFTNADIQVAEITMTHWTNFAKSGHPNIPKWKSTIWPEYTAESREYLKFTGDKTSLTSSHTNVGEPRTSFWLKIIPTLTGSTAQQSTTETNTDYVQVQVDNEMQQFSERLNLDATSAENIIIILAITTGVLFLILIATCVIIGCKERRETNYKI